MDPQPQLPIGQQPSTPQELAPTATSPKSTESTEMQIVVAVDLNPTEGSSKKCNCKRSKCLKLYCECFSANVLCKNCKCLDCENVKGMSILVTTPAAVSVTVVSVFPFFFVDGSPRVISIFPSTVISASTGGGQWAVAACDRLTRPPFTGSLVLTLECKPQDSESICSFLLHPASL